MITQERLKYLATYDSETGLFERRVRVAGSSMLKWKQFGSNHNTGYLKANIDSQPYLLHRLAWLYVYGYMPKEIDHIDRDKKNNRISNLRIVTRQQNKVNQGPQSNNTSGERGIDFLKRLGKYRVRVCKQHYGMYCTLEEAVSARDKALSSFF